MPQKSSNTVNRYKFRVEMGGILGIDLCVDPEKVYKSDLDLYLL